MESNRDPSACQPTTFTARPMWPNRLTEKGPRGRVPVIKNCTGALSSEVGSHFLFTMLRLWLLWSPNDVCIRTWYLTSTKTVRLVRDGEKGEGYGGGGRGRLYTYRYSHHQNDFCIKVGSNESHFNVL